MKKQFTPYSLKQQFRSSTALLGLLLLSSMLISIVCKAQNFNAPIPIPFGIDSVDGASFPALADIDNDGDLDFLSGAQINQSNKQEFHFQENIGTATNPIFGPQEENPFGLENSDGMSYPEFVDLDADGDQDIFVSIGSGDIKYFENIGTPTNASYAAAVDTFTYDSIYSRGFSFVDLDDDGDLDLMQSANIGQFYYRENIGTANAPFFATPVQNPFDLTPSSVNNILIKFGDLDGDNDYDIWGVNVYGQFVYHENTGSSTSPLFSEELLNPFGLTKPDGTDILYPHLCDLDGDKDIDIIVGVYKGGNDRNSFFYFENTEFTTSTKSQSISNEITLFPNPATTSISLEIEGRLEGKTKVDIYNGMGQLILQGKISNAQTILDISHFPTGLYVANIAVDGKQKTLKFIVE